MSSFYFSLPWFGNNRWKVKLRLDDILELVSVMEAALYDGIVDVENRGSGSFLQRNYSFFGINWINCVDCIRNTLGFCLRTMNGSPPMNNNELNRTRRVRRLARPIWLRGIETLRAPRAKVDYGWKRNLEYWTRLGQLLKLDDSSLDEKWDGLHSRNMIERQCQWMDCLCSAYKCAHSFFACKGCMEVVYCNAICQRRYVICV